jgi:hypothetical protein
VFTALDCKWVCCYSTVLLLLLLVLLVSTAMTTVSTIASIAAATTITADTCQHSFDSACHNNAASCTPTVSHCIPGEVLEQAGLSGTGVIEDQFQVCTNTTANTDTNTTVIHDYCRVCTNRVALSAPTTLFVVV